MDTIRLVFCFGSPTLIGVVAGALLSKNPKISNRVLTLSFILMGLLLAVDLWLTSIVPIPVDSISLGPGWSFILFSFLINLVAFMAGVTILVIRRINQE